jgi:hypothetical protein
MIYIGPQIFSFSQACHGTRLKATCNIFFTVTCEFGTDLSNKESSRSMQVHSLIHKWNELYDAVIYTEWTYILTSSTGV